jgi:Ca-activated chloride channel family protein
MGHECPRHFAAAFLAAALAAGLSAQTVFRADVSLVRVTATARNRVGQLVGTLAKEDFEIFDNGVRQEIAVFERRSEQPLSVAVLIDVSGSTAKDIKYETDSAAKFLRALLREGNPEDRVALYSFDDSVRLIQDFTHNYTLLEAQLRKVHGSAGTSLYDAIWLASTEGLEAREGRKVIVVVSDGGETTSIKDSHQALAAAQMADATMYPVVDVPITNDAGRNVGGENALTFMAQGTGGRTFLPATAAELDSAFASIINDLRTSYLLGYYPRGVPLTKERFHKLELRAKIPGLQVSARNGYYGDAIGKCGFRGRSRVHGTTGEEKIVGEFATAQGGKSSRAPEQTLGGNQVPQAADRDRHPGAGETERRRRSGGGDRILRPFLHPDHPPMVNPTCSFSSTISSTSWRRTSLLRHERTWKRR